MDLLIKDALILTFDEEDRVIQNGYVLIRNGIIAEVGEEAFKVEKGVNLIDVKGRVLLPGLINMHTHLYSSLARGMPFPQVNSFYDILERIWWKLDKALDEEDIYLSALLGLMDSVRRGVTTLFDHHSSPNFTRGSLDIIEKAVRDVGVRASLSYEVTDRNGRKKRDEAIEENVRFIEKVKGDSRVKSTFGLHASFTLSEETLDICVEKKGSLNVGFHIHVAEGPEDEEDSIRKYNERVVERLSRWGILGEKSLLIHGVHLDRREIEILRDTKTPLIHNPSSNLNNAVGMAPLTQMLKNSIVIGLGTDGFGEDILGEMKNAFLLLKHGEKDPNIGVEAFGFLKNNSRLASLHFGKTLGRIEKGALGDVVLYDYKPPTPLNEKTVFPHLFFGLSLLIPDTVVVGGEVIYEKGRFLKVDEDEILRKTMTRAQKIWEKL